jgi:ferredoxin/flavodoxin---NADP+ reductase
VLECGLVLRSVGYRGTPLEGVPFDPERHVIPNDGGRVAPGEYCSGWIKRGPSGIIGTNKKDANETAALILEDAAAGLLPTPADPSPDTIEALVAERQPHLVEYAGWEAIDAHERQRGEPHGRPRVKLSTWDELMALGRRASKT